ncbi:metal-dependent hydrolase [Chitinophaga sancti]|uniref:L-ascorbate metabolism protein UlaG, beta-lactamase superfamily n=1 Tax=Chitinophaga sancti TaxID=1004 RepID=A0A1K1PS59_9BACT|nr:metal-dependent hydrolase [Chitinophaga sancti]WQD61724.1 metal-dependent hydrolase [Chitinophaga sancti]WQG92718.1 metal-dependent hydrolase [Chitinophaga sancti]SFW50299.1 L-ascorbate metabolism protein UlaG, beta-lactamase superfamily [Chitinophaga sancti]
MKLTFYGHSCFAVEIKGKKIVFDPFITYNELAKAIDVNKLEADYIFMSHGHEDHIADLVPLAKRTQATVVAVPEVLGWAKKQGVEKGHPMNIGGKWNFDFGTVKCVVATHTSSMPDGSYGGTPVGYVFTTTAGNFYFSGDTGLTMDMQLIPRWAKLDFAVLPLGDNFTMGAADAIIAAEFIDCKRIVGIHYDTFGYIKIDQEKTKQQFTQAGLELLLPAIGTTIDL